MATVPTYPPGVAVTTSDLAWFAASRPLASASTSTPQSLPSGAWTTVTVSTVAVDRDSGSGGGTYTVGNTTSALYLAAGQVTFAASTAGTLRGVRLLLNGAAVPGSLVTIPPSALSTPQTVTVPTVPVVSTAAGDVLALQAFHDTGSALSTTATPVLTVEYAGAPGVLAGPAVALLTAGTVPVVKTEIEFTPGTWVDVSPWVLVDQPIQLSAGRSNEFDDIQPATLHVTFDNSDGRFMTNSTASPYYPDVVEGKRVRQHVTYGAATTALFSGKITAWVPSWPPRDLTAGATCVITASDPLADLAAIPFIDRWTEEAKAIARAASSWCDIPVLAGDSTTITLDNAGVTSTTLGACAVAGPGTFGTPAGLTVAHAFSVAGGAASLTVTPQGAPQSANFWVQIPTDVLPVVTGAGGVVGTVGAVTVGVKMLDATTGIVDLVLGVGSGLPTILADVADGTWRHISMVPVSGTPTSTLITVSDATGAVVATYTAAADMRSASAGFGSRTMSFAGIVISGAPTPVATVRGLATGTASLLDTYAALQSYVPAVTSWAVVGVENPTIGEPTWVGKTPLDVLQQLARTVGGVAYATGSGAVTLYTSDVAWPPAPGCTIDAASDIDYDKGEPNLVRDAGNQPTRITVTYATGTTTVIDTAAEAAGKTVNTKTLDTCAVDQASAIALGEAFLGSALGTWVTGIPVDLVAAVTNLWAPFLALIPTAMVRIGDIPSGLFGATYRDVYVQGWSVDVTGAAMAYTLNCTPLGNHAAAAWDTSLWDDPASTWRI